MAIKKSDLYSSLWASCDELRGGMDASQYKDYVLFMLFIKYITDKYGNSSDFASPVSQFAYGDVLLNEGQSLELVGRCAIYRDEYPEPCAIQNQLLRFRPRPE